MIAYLTSHIGGSYKTDGRRIPTKLSTDNRFLDNLRNHWKNDSDVLIISADPNDIEINDNILNIYAAAFPMSGLSIKRINIIDKRNAYLTHDIADYDVVILVGGHVPTQNLFFEEIQLKDYLHCFDGILIGISAGSMNSAEIVYAQPELEGESVDKDYKRFLPGLGITSLMILPHYQNTKDEVLDGKRLYEDITYPDSYGRKFYALVDGSYLLIEDNTATLFGEAYLIKDGDINQVCEKDQSICIK